MPDEVRTVLILEVRYDPGQVPHPKEWLAVAIEKELRGAVRCKYVGHGDIRD